MVFGFIGAGNMVSSIIKGYYKNSNYENKIFVSSKSGVSCEKLSNIYKNCHSIKSNIEVVNKSDIIIIGVKPYNLEEVLFEIKDEVIKKNVTIISMVAGKNIDFFENILGNKIEIIRVMPNINSEVLMSTTGYCKNSNTTKVKEEVAIELFKSIGDMIFIEENLFDTFMLLGGSSVAFTYLYANALASSGVQYGLKKDKALEIVAHTLIGCGNMLLEGDNHPLEIVDKISSPKGITIEGINTLYKNGFEGKVIEAVTAMMDKSKII